MRPSRQAMFHRSTQVELIVFLKRKRVRSLIQPLDTVNAHFEFGIEAFRVEHLTTQPAVMLRRFGSKFRITQCTFVVVHFGENVFENE